MATAAALYTPEVLGLATALAAWPLASDLPLVGRARSVSCGSTLTLGLGLDGTGRISRLGIAAQACAVGQAAAALFVQSARGMNRDDVAADARAIRAWLAEGADMPAILAPIARAAAYPARHGAILLPWQAALDALSLTPPPR